MEPVAGATTPEARKELLTASAAAHTAESFGRALISNVLQALAHSVGDEPLEGQSIQANIFVRRASQATDELIPHIELCVHIPEHGGHPEHLACVFWPPIFIGHGPPPGH